ncbi:hypothetical protein C8R44DRAFT_728900 [Mycena epipterygia]|nr:hypothetical protein C8R44DRAFT_728900 [Mycena epipterygia]
MVAFTLLLPLLFVTKYVPAIATKHGLALRQTSTSGSDSDCNNECNILNNDFQTCNNTIVTDAVTCYSCMIKAGDITQEDAQDTLNEFILECDSNGQTVNNVTITADGSAPAGSGSTSTTAVKPTKTPSPTETDSETESPTETDSTDSPDATDSAGNSSASASASGSSAGAAANAGDGVGLATKSAAVMSAVLVVVSTIVNVGGL